MQSVPRIPNAEQTQCFTGHYSNQDSASQGNNHAATTATTFGQRENRPASGIAQSKWIGQRIDRYIVQQSLGGGGMGEVFLASHKIQVGNHIFKFLAGDSIESQYHETVYSMMTMDGLTNVFNKRYLVDAIAREFERSKTYGRPFSVVMMDIDFFKKFNDNYGHLAGDEVLQEFASRVQALCGSSQIFARFGGEEFALLLIETESQKATDFAEQARRIISDTTFSCCAGELPVTASFGVAQFDPTQHANFSELLELADQRLYTAKQNGRNQVCASN